MLRNFFARFWHHWKILLKDKAYRISLLIGALVLSVSYFVTLTVSSYNDTSSYLSVGDAILDKLPTYNLEFLFIWGISFIVLWGMLYIVFYKPEILPFTLKTLGVLFLVRSGFIVLTHVGPPAGFYYDNLVSVDYNPLNSLVFRNDLFFSGHTSLPFMLFLLLKDTKFKWFMLASSLLMGATVLLMHVHYSIDVFAAFFITYGIYALSNKIFNNLNIRFRRRIKRYGWNAFQKRFNKYREKRRLANESVEIEKHIAVDKKQP
ncbi:hypothetical protein GF354_00940 [Candidatus Peregrinibacteria bacterium]|nr:hypothetical protein [Candidatus Peregrinibacteria bacterium]